MKRPRTRLALRLAACVVVGAVATVVAAWGALVISGSMQLSSGLGAWVPEGDLHEGSRSGTVIAYGHRDGTVVSLSRSIVVSGDRLIDEVRFHAGFPARALRGASEYTSDSRLGFAVPVFPPRGTAHQGLRLPRSAVGVTAGTLPVAPLWPGFALDTAFYGILAFLFWSAPGFIRRQRRRRRGQCLSCGYELKGITKCPECGAS